MSERGKFIVIEGPDGSSKTTQAARLQSRLVGRMPHGSILTREPTDGPIGRLIRQALRREVALAPAAMAPLYAADRLHHVATVIEPALGGGDVVVCDRYLLSNLVYRGAEHPAMRCPDCDLEGDAHVRRCPQCGSIWICTNKSRRDAIEWGRTLSRGAPRPDLTIVLTAPLEVCAARRRARGGSAEFYDDGVFQTRVHALYADAQRLLPGEHVAMVDASGSVETVEEKVWAVVQEVLA